MPPGNLWSHALEPLGSCRIHHQRQQAIKQRSPQDRAGHAGCRPLGLQAHQRVSGAAVADHLVDDAGAILLKRQLDRQTGELDAKTRNAKGLLVAVIILSVCLVAAVAIRLFSR